MSVPGTLVSYRLLPSLLLFTLLLIPLSDASQDIRYKCLKRGENPYIAVLLIFKGENVDNIFGKGAEDSCSVKSNNITGRGTRNSPYQLFVNVSGIGDVNGGICGIDKKGDLVELTIITRTSTGTFASLQDKEAKIKCDFSKDQLAESPVQVNLIEQKAIEINVNLTLEFDGSPTELTVGTETFLKLRLWTLDYLTMIEPFRCWAMRNPNDVNKVLLFDEYCPVTGSPVKIKFSNYKSYSRHRSDKFPIFRFFDSDTLFIRCMVDLCVNPGDCFRMNCAAKRKRSVSEEGRHLHIASTSTSVIVKGKGSSKFLTKTHLPFIGTLFPIAVFLNVILIAVVGFLGIKLIKRKMNNPTKNIESSKE